VHGAARVGLAFPDFHPGRPRNSACHLTFDLQMATGGVRTVMQPPTNDCFRRLKNRLKAFALNDVQGPCSENLKRLRFAHFQTVNSTSKIKAPRYRRGLSVGLIRTHRESSDKPILNAFCRVAPSVRFRVRAMLAARVFFLASVFSVRTSEGDHERRLELLGI
jgi:hypothetical protein